MAEDVNTASQSSEAVSTDDNSTQENAGTEETAKTTAKAGDKTDPNLLLESLREEREKRRALEERLSTLESSVSSGEDAEYVSKSEFAELKTKLTKAEVLSAHPELKDKWDSFEEFREDPENKGMSMKTAAKAFLVEKGLLETPRKGLEKPTGGQRVPLTSGMSVEDVKRLRETDFKKYQQMLMKGQLTIA